MRTLLFVLIILMPACSSYNGVCAGFPLGQSGSAMVMRVHCEADK